MNNTLKIQVALLSMLCLFFGAKAQLKSQKIHELVEANVNSLKPFSGSILVAQNDEVVYKGAFGFADIEKGIKNKVDSKYFIGSLTKQFTTVAVLQLIENNQLSFDDKISQWLPEINGSHKISIHHLLTHQSGLPRDSKQDYDEDVPYLERVLSVKQDTLLFEPGDQERYSSVGFYVLTYIIEEVSGKKYEEYFNEHIFKPAGMKNTGVRKKRGDIIEGLSKGIDRSPDEFGVDRLAHAQYFSSYSLAGGGALYSTVEDMFKFSSALENGKLVSKEMVWKMKLKWPTKTERKSRLYHSFGWEVWDLTHWDDPLTMFDYAGRIYGYKAMHRYYEKDGIVIIVLCNSDYSERSNLGWAIRNILLDKAYEIPKPASPKIPFVESMKKHLGTYDFPSEETTVEIKLINGRMTLTSHGDKPMYLYPANFNTFYSDLIPLKITFEPTAKDSTQRLEFNHNNEFVKTIERKKN
ncbi:MAG: serine hydrolase domain-containing protein [Flagellimonas sp.]